jgi:hypothetical protein
VHHDSIQFKPTPISAMERNIFFIQIIQIIQINQSLVNSDLFLLSREAIAVSLRESP